VSGAQARAQAQPAEAQRFGDGVYRARVLRLLAERPGLSRTMVEAFVGGAKGRVREAINGLAREGAVVLTPIPRRPGARVWLRDAAPSSPAR